MQLKVLHRTICDDHFRRKRFRKDQSAFRPGRELVGERQKAAPDKKKKSFTHSEQVS